jgi:hypothetical protein
MSPNWRAHVAAADLTDSLLRVSAGNRAFEPTRWLAPGAVPVFETPYDNILPSIDKGKQ